MMKPRDFDPARETERARSALWSLDAGCSRPEWVRLGMAAKAAGLDFEDWLSVVTRFDVPMIT